MWAGQLPPSLCTEEVLERRGSFWFGKFGKTLRAEVVDSLNEQIGSGTPTFLYLVEPKGRGWFKARLVGAQRSKPATSALIPSYYDELSHASRAGLWFRAVTLEAVTPLEVRRLLVKSSGLRVQEVIANCMAPMFIAVAEKKRPADPPPLGMVPTSAIVAAP